MKKIICILLASAILLSMAGCVSGKPAAKPQDGSVEAQENPKTSDEQEYPKTSVDLMQTITSNEKESAPITPEAASAASDFALRLFRTADDPEQNTLISPLSVLSALAMTANGAEDETLREMENTLGMDRDQYNEFFNSFRSSLRYDSDKALKLANSIWFTDRHGFEPKDEFLETNASCYGADACLAPFDDSTLREINGWVNEKTDGLIPSILDEISNNAELYLVNALAFDAKWSFPYEENDVEPGVFTAADGTKQEVDFMHSLENDYLSDDSATGFIKYYVGRKYAFVALLPNESVSIVEYLDSLDGEKLQSLIENRSKEDVITETPKFESETSLELSRVLMAMGMELPFDKDEADFSGMGTLKSGKLYISGIRHKAYISVYEEGTRAGAATVDVMEYAAEMEEEKEPPKYVTLDRPFVYMLFDMETNVPLFIGTMLNPKEKQ